MAFASSTTKTKTNYMSTEVTQVLTGGAGTGDLILSEGLPAGSAHVVLTSGTTPTSVGLLGGNDGIKANMVALGSVANSFPAISSLTSVAADAPCKWYAFVVVGGDATTVLTINLILMGARG